MAVMAVENEIELTLFECGGKQRKEKFVKSEIESLSTNIHGNTLVLTRGGYWPVAEPIEMIHEQIGGMK